MQKALPPTNLLGNLLLNFLPMKQIRILCHQPLPHLHWRTTPNWVGVCCSLYRIIDAGLHQHSTHMSSHYLMFGYMADDKRGVGGEKYIEFKLSIKIKNSPETQLTVSHWSMDRTMGYPPPVRWEVQQRRTH